MSTFVNNDCQTLSALVTRSYMYGRILDERTYRYRKATDESKVDVTCTWENVRAEVVCEEDSLVQR